MGLLLDRYLPFRHRFDGADWVLGVVRLISSASTYIERKSALAQHDSERCWLNTSGPINIGRQHA